MFKERLRKVGREALFTLGMLVVMVVWCLLLLAADKLFNISETLHKITDKQLGYAILAVLVVIVICLIARFIKWLFVEPYRNYKNNKETMKDA